MFHSLKWQQVLYLCLRMIAIIFCAIGVALWITIGVALWITVGVVVSNPPNDSKWKSTLSVSASPSLLPAPQTRN